MICTAGSAETYAHGRDSLRGGYQKDSASSLYQTGHCLSLGSPIRLYSGVIQGGIFPTEQTETMKWDRRTFLQTLLSWGVAQESLTWLSHNHRLKQYYQTLAEPTHRKLALLVGINNYAPGFTLKGCLTDVERQKELLIHRFGFQASDILTVTDKEASRHNIETAFVEHLIQQAKAGDVVIFHFSGYGNYVNLSPNLVPTVSNGQLPAIIPGDGVKLDKEKPLTNNLLQETLMLLGRSLATDKLTMVLDTSYDSKGNLFQGNLRVRSFPNATSNIDPEELTFQEQLKQKLPKSQTSASPGIILSAARPEQVATEIKGNGFSAGLFTYALTQYLWSIAPASSINIALNKTREQILPLMGRTQQPQQQNSPKQPLFTYYLLPTLVPGAEAFISSVEDSGTATITLTGLPANIVRHYGLNSTFCPIITDSSTSSVCLQLRSRNGLKAKVRQPSTEETSAQPLRVGQLLQESIRCLSRSIGLTVGLDPKLQRIERVDATSAFATINTVSEVVNEGEQPVDCILGLPSSFSTVSSQTQETGTYALFLPGGVQIPNTMGKSGEAIKSAVERLRPNLEKLLAIKLWSLTLNEGSSQLPWCVTLEGLDPQPYPIQQRQTTRSQTIIPQKQGNNSDRPIPNLSALPKIELGTRLRYHLENKGEKPLYYLILAINSLGKAMAYLPAYEEPEKETSPLPSTFIEPGMSNFIPTLTTGLTWTTSTTQGWEQVLVMAAITPFNKTLEVLQKIPEFKIDKEQILTMENPLEVAQALLQDLTTASTAKNPITEPNSDSYTLDVQAWSTLSFIYQVI